MIYGEIHEFISSQNLLDELGEPKIGWYYRFMTDGSNMPVSELTGPYSSGLEAERACQHAFEKGDY